MKSKLNSACLLVLLILTLMSTLMQSCTKDEPEVTSYQIINNMQKVETSYEYLDGSMYEIVVLQYKGTEVIKQDNIRKISSGGGKSEVIKTDPQCEKISISFKMLPPESPYYNLSSNDRIYVVTRYYLTPNKTTSVTIDGNTIVL